MNPKEFRRGDALTPSDPLHSETLRDEASGSTSDPTMNGAGEAETRSKLIVGWSPQLVFAIVVGATAGALAWIFVTVPDHPWWWGPSVMLGAMLLAPAFLAPYKLFSK
jgi:hypothetical protein